MGTILPPSYDEFVDHLKFLIDDHPTDLDENLAITFQAQLNNDSIQACRPTVLPLVTAALKILATDPTALTNLFTTLTADLTYSQLSLDPATLLLTLSAPHTSYRRLALSLLSKAAASNPSAAVVGSLASEPDIVRQLLKVALADDDTGVADRAGTVLFELLEADTTDTEHGGLGLLWRRVFEDASIYREFFVYTSPLSDKLSTYQRSIAQTRLLELLLKLMKLDWEKFVRPNLEDVERKFVKQEEGDEWENFGGLAVYALLRMVDETDVVIHVNLLQFYTNLLKIHPGYARRLLEATGRLDHIVHIFEDPESYDAIWADSLEGGAADFLATLCQTAPSESLQRPDTAPLIDRLIFLVSRNIKAASSSNPASAPTLRLLGNLPKETLASPAGANLLRTIPLWPPHTPHLGALVSAFSQSPTVIAAYLQQHHDTDAMYERLLHYLRTPQLGADCVEAAVEIVYTLFKQQEVGHDPRRMMKSLLNTFGAWLVEPVESSYFDLAGGRKVAEGRGRILEVVQEEWPAEVSGVLAGVDRNILYERGRGVRGVVGSEVATLEL